IVSNNLGVTETVALLETLRGVLREFSAKEEALTSELRARAAAEEKAADAAGREQAARQSARKARLQQTRQDKTLAEAALFERRRNWIAQAKKGSVKRALDLVEEKEGRQKYKLQQTAIEAERARDAGRAAAATALKTFQENLAANRQAFILLE